MGSMHENALSLFLNEYAIHNGVASELILILFEVTANAITAMLSGNKTMHLDNYNSRTRCSAEGLERARFLVQS
jgi:hypothetical protein